MIRVSVVDDHEVVRMGLRHILGAEKDMRVVEDFATGEAFLVAAQRLPWDVALVDLTMPGQGGLETVRQLKARFPRRPVLVLTMHSEEEYALRALKAGADGFLSKENLSQNLAGAIRQVVGGRKYITPRLAELMAAELGSSRGDLPHESLSDREYQVFRKLAEGRSVTKIGEELGLSVKTISTNRSRLLKKLGLSNNAELVHYAIRHGLVETPDTCRRSPTAQQSNSDAKAALRRPQSRERGR